MPAGVERLSDLPTVETSPTKEEKDTIEQFFGKSPQSSSSTSGTPRTWSESIRLAGIASLVFLAIANPIVDKIVCIVPLCGNFIGALALKTLLFLIVFFILLKWCV